MRTRTNRYLIDLAIVALIAAAIFACPKKNATKKPDGEAGQKVVLRYKFPAGRLTKYRIEEDSFGKFSMSLIAAPQKVRASNSMTVLEKVLQAPVGGYALVGRKISKLAVVIWKNDAIYFDSDRMQRYQDRPEAGQYLSMKNKVVKYEINELGKTKSIDGLLDYGLQDGATSPMEMLETGYPVFSEGGVNIGDTWTDKREMPFNVVQGYVGVMEVTEEVTLVELKILETRTIAVLDDKRKVQMKVYDAATKNLWKGFQGEGSSEGRIYFDMQNGVILNSDIRSRLSVKTKVNTKGKPSENSSDFSFNTKTRFIK